MASGLVMGIYSTGMNIRFGEEKDFLQLAEMKWLHGMEDDADYNEHNLDGVNRQRFISDFVEFLKSNKDYKIFVAEDNDIVVSAMFIYLIPKIPKPNGQAKYIAYLTNVFTIREYRNKKIGTELLSYIKKYLSEQKCELLFAWPSEKSVDWYIRNEFLKDNEIFECCLTDKGKILR